ncbi:MAG: preprotein translocase subunit SecA [Proteobacteria bacterium]|nr:preprotein translocase subunit SecA [Pseudomonadota bacterium]
MKSGQRYHPPATRSDRPEKKEHRHNVVEKAVLSLTGGFVRYARMRMIRPIRIVPLVKAFEPVMGTLNDHELKAEARQVGLKIRQQGFRDDLVAHSFALIREVAWRTLGLRHFDTQLMGGWVLLQGMIAEMETGEGKTLTATLAAGSAALAGIPVHVICVNDYLTARDAEWMGPVYRALGLKVGCVTHEVPHESRQAAYQCDVVYCNNKEITFDYLRDKLVLGELTHPIRLQAEHLYSNMMREEKLLLRGLHFAIADEADSLLIDESRTPLIISGAAGGSEEEAFMREALSVADDLQEGEDYLVNRNESMVDLTDRGVALIKKLTISRGSLWRGTIRRNDIVRNALSARHLFHRDIHYLVCEGKVQIVDEYTGRLMPDRSWEKGIHQLIEIKEGCEVTQHRESLARITYQRFFRRYRHLCGMTGTAWEVRGELGKVYGLTVARIPTNRPLIRVRHPDRIMPSLEAKYQAVRERVRQLHQSGHPVLVGTRSVSVSEEISCLFDEDGLGHQVLNAKNDQDEAGIIARAGEYGNITIATNMAGRGTDIKLGPDVAKRGGLHVILTERHDSGRIDRQLIGRCARQGDPGSHEAFFSLEDPILGEKRGRVLIWIIRKTLSPGTYIWTLAVKMTILLAQKRMEQVHARMRQELLKMDEKVGTTLSFSGTRE